MKAHVPDGVKNASITMLVIAGAMVIAGAVLQWANLEGVTDTALRRGASSYFVTAGVFQWVFCVVAAALHYQEKIAAGGAFMFLGASLLAFVSTNYPSYSQTNFWRLFRESQQAEDEATVNMMLAGEILTYIGTWVALVAAMLMRQEKGFKRDYFVLGLSTVAAIMAAVGVIVLLTSDNADLPISAGSVEFLDRAALYDELYDVVEKSIFLTVLLCVGVWFDTLEVVAEGCFFLGENTIFIFADVFRAQHYRQQLFSENSEIDELYIGGTLCWVSSIVAFCGALIFFRNKMGDDDVTYRA